LDKGLIEVYVPAINRSFDIQIPLLLKLHEIEKTIISMIEELSEGAFAGSSDTVLCDRATGQLFDVNMTANELGIKNGSLLMLI